MRSFWAKSRRTDGFPIWTPVTMNDRQPLCITIGLHCMKFSLAYATVIVSRNTSLRHRFVANIQLEGDFR